MKPVEEGETLVACVLVVDDEKSVRDVLTRLLARERELSVQTADSAEAAIALLQAQRFDLLITDKNLPRMDGVELIGVARSLRPNIESIVITAYASSVSVIAAFAAGASDYVVKPFDQIGVVRAKIRAALDRRKERVKVTAESHQMALEASQLLAEGQTVSPPAWRRLDEQLGVYEQAMRADSNGTVLVVGSTAAVAQLKAEGVEAIQAEPDDPLLDAADVVVIDTAFKQWRELVERLTPLKPDLMLTADPNQDLAELLEAIALKLEPVGITVLASRVRELLMRQAVHRAKKSLAAALTEFRGALEK